MVPKYQVTKIKKCGKVLLKNGYILSYYRHLIILCCNGYLLSCKNTLYVLCFITHLLPLILHGSRTHRIDKAPLATSVHNRPSLSSHNLWSFFPQLCRGQSTGCLPSGTELRIFRGIHSSVCFFLFCF